MNVKDPVVPQSPGAPSQPPDDLPPGNHPLEVAARRGFGPLSPLGKDEWHGWAKPCVSCGQLVRREAPVCDFCAQDLSSSMLEKMRAHAGPWYVREHVRPFPGVDLERIVRQIRRGLITETTIVRGPSSDHQWRFAVEIPGLCRYFGRCWNCHDKVTPSDTYCQHCLAYLSFEQPKARSTSPSSLGGEDTRAASPAGATEMPPVRHAGAVPPIPDMPSEAEPAASDDRLRQLSEVLGRADLPSHRPEWDEPPRIAGIRATWVAAVLLLAVIVLLTWLTQTRTLERPSPGSGTPTAVTTEP